MKSCIASRNSSPWRLRSILRDPRNLERTTGLPGALLALVALAAFMRLSGSALADCIDYSGYMAWVGSLDLPPTPKDVAVSATTAYVACGESGVWIADVSDPSNPLHLGSLDTPGDARDLVAAGDYAYLADYAEYGAGLQIIDASDPEAPVIAHLEPMSRLVSVALSESYLYALCDGDPPNLFVFLVNNPVDPQLVTWRLVSDSLPTDVAVSGDYAYVRTSSWLDVFDVSSPANPQLLGEVNIGGYDYSRVAAIGNHAFVTSGDVLDIVDADGLEIVGSVGLATGAGGVAATGNYVYVSASGLQVVDVSDPTHPLALGWMPTQGGAAGMAVSGGHGYFVGSGAGRMGLRVVRVTVPQVSQAIGGVLLPQGLARRVAVSGSFLYVASSSFGLRVIDVSDPATPVIVGGVPTPGSPRDVVVSGDYAYLTDSVGLQVIDVSNPEVPQIVGGIDTGGATALAISGTYVYLSISGGFKVIDVSNPQNPLIIGSWWGEALGVAVPGNHAYLTQGGYQHGYFWVIDFTDPANPQAAGSLRTPGESPTDVAASGSYAYVADGEFGLEVIDVSDPQTPQIVGATATPHFAGDLSLCDGFAYVADQNNYYPPSGLLAIDVRDAQNPRLLGGAQPPGFTWGVAATSDFVFTADRGDGIHVFPAQCETSSTAGDEAGVPAAGLCIWPNPSSSGTSIRLSIPVRGLAQAAVFEVSGRWIRSLLEDMVDQGVRELRWDGCNATGQAVAPGVYCVRAQIAGRSTTGKIVMLHP